MKQRCVPGFERLLRGFDLTGLEAEEGSVFGLQPDFRLAYFNPAWQEFARRNSGEPAISSSWGLGSNLFAAIPGVLEPFFRELFGQGPNPPDRLRPVVHEYECSSADTYRRFAMHVYRLRGDGGWLVVNSLLAQLPHEAASRVPQAADPLLYVDSQGIVRQCSHCRRIRAAATETRWDWVPDWVEKPPVATSHTLCSVCLDYYYPADDEPP